jgi:rSAM/selenodomain-associated transferase 1
MSRARIVILAKEPLPGRVKTRLIPALGAEGAARLARQMLQHTVTEALASGLDVELCGDPDPASWHDPLAAVRLTEQGAGDLGERLARAAERVVPDQPVLLIGTDCPGLDRIRLCAAAEAFDGHDAVIHPAADGGFALLGLRRSDPSLFAGIAWSTPSVAEQIVARIAELGWSLHIADTLRDIDEPGDLG